MGSNLTTAPHAMLPGLVDEIHIGRLVDSFQIEESGRDICLDRLPTKAERELFQYRNVNLTKQLRPCNLAATEMDGARKHLGMMFAGFPNLRRADTDELLNAYLWVLQKFPLFAVIEACADVTGNRVAGLKPEFPPTSPQMAKFADDHVTRVAAEQLKIDKILRAKQVMRPPDTVGAGERVMVSLKDFHNRMNAGPVFGTLTQDDKERITSREKLEARQAVLREWAHLGLSPIVGKDGTVISPTLARQMGLLMGPESAIR